MLDVFIVLHPITQIALIAAVCFAAYLLAQVFIALLNRL